MMLFVLFCTFHPTNASLKHSKACDLSVLLCVAFVLHLKRIQNSLVEKVGKLDVFPKHRLPQTGLTRQGQAE